MNNIFSVMNIPNKSLYFSNLKIGVSLFIHKTSILCLTLEEYISWQLPLDLLCKTSVVLNVPLFGMVCLTMSLVEMFMCLFPIILPP